MGAIAPISAGKLLTTGRLPGRMGEISPKIRCDTDWTMRTPNTAAEAAETRLFQLAAAPAVNRGVRTLFSQLSVRRDRLFGYNLLSVVTE